MGRRIKEEKTRVVFFFFFFLLPSLLLLLWLGDGRLETLKINSVNATSTSFSFFFIPFLSFPVVVPPALASLSLSL
jgi:hypothetical protein